MPRQYLAERRISSNPVGIQEIIATIIRETSTNIKVARAANELSSH
jgi:hypothetical protein